jgi:hypothetical protein
VGCGGGAALHRRLRDGLRKEWFRSARARRVLPRLPGFQKGRRSGITPPLPSNCRLKSLRRVTFGSLAVFFVWGIGEHERGGHREGEGQAVRLRRFTHCLLLATTSNCCCISLIYTDVKYDLLLVIGLVQQG